MEEKKLNLAIGYIGNALRSVAKDHITSFAEDCFDEDRQEYQSDINSRHEEELNKTSQILSIDDIGKYATLFIDGNGYIGIALTKNGKSLFDEDTNQFNAKIADDAIIKGILLNINKILEHICFETNKSGFVDKNGNAALYADANGVHLANIISHDTLGRIAIIDENGNIGFMLTKDGKTLANFGILGVREINIGNNFYQFDETNGIITLPKNLFTYNEAKLMLPSKIPYVVGQRMSVYYESILYNGFIKDYRINSRTFNEGQQHECYIYHDSVVSDTINFRLDNSFGNNIESKKVNVNVIPKEKDGAFKICVIGDSKSDNATKQSEVLNLCEKDKKLSVTFVGTINKIGHDSDGNQRSFSNCAISGSGIADWCCAETITSKENPFYDAGVESGVAVTMRTNTGNYNNSPIKFSVEKAISKIGEFDILWLDHGANQPSNDETFKCYDYIINDIKKYNNTNNKHIKIVISIQEGFALIPQLDIKAKYLRTKDSLYNAAQYIDKYDNKEDEDIFICPQYLNVDLWNDFACAIVNQSMRNKDATKKICLDSVHPGVSANAYSESTQYHLGDLAVVKNGVEQNMYMSLSDNINIEPVDDKKHWAKVISSNSGYYKIADMYYATIRYILSLT